MCGWDGWSGMYRREGGAGDFFCPSAGIVRAGNFAGPGQKKSTVVLVVFLRWRECFGGPTHAPADRDGKRSQDHGRMYLDMLLSFDLCVWRGVAFRGAIFYCLCILFFRERPACFLAQLFWGTRHSPPALSISCLLL